MDIKEYLLCGLKIVWNKPYDVQFVDENDKFSLLHYHFMEGEICRVLVSSKKSKWCGVHLTRSNLVFPYYQFKFETLQELYDREILSIIS